MLASVDSAVLEGVDGRVVTVEVHVSNGLPGYTVVGLPDAAGRESRERVRAALLSSELTYPHRTRHGEPRARVGAQGRTRARARGRARAHHAPTRAPVRCARRCRGARRARPRRRGATGRGHARAGRRARRAAGTGCVIVPAANAAEAALVPGVHVRVARSLGELHACLKGECPWPDPPDPPTGVATKRSRRAARPRRRARARQRAARVSGRGRGRAPPAARRAAGRRQDDARPPPAHDHAAARSRRGARGHPHPLGRGTQSPSRALQTHPPFRAPHHSASSVVARRRRQPARAARRDHARAPRRAVSRRAARVPDQRARRRCASRSKSGWSASAARRAPRVPRRLPARRVRESVPVRTQGAECRCADAQRMRYSRRLSAPLLDRFDLRLRIDAPGTETGRVVGDDRAPASAPRSNGKRRGSRERAWRRNAHIPAGALELLIVPLAPTRTRPWTDACRLRLLTGRGAARSGASPARFADLDDRAGRNRRRRDARGLAPRGRVVSTDRTRHRGRDARVATARSPGRDSAGCSTRTAIPWSRSKRCATGSVTNLIGRCEEHTPTRTRTSVERICRVRTRSRSQLDARDTHVWIAGDHDYPIPRCAPRPAAGAARRRRPARRVRRAARRHRRHARRDAARPRRRTRARRVPRDAGVTVVSGLAIGIDGAAHEGALDAGGLAVGVVATGLDVVYPRRHRALYARVREQGLVVGETRLRRPAPPRRFPVRNRIIAALADIVVVVEATATGGARITAQLRRRLRPRRVRAARLAPEPGRRGCNALIADGAETLLDPGDLLIALGRGGTRPGAGVGGRGPPADDDEAAVLRALGGDPATIDDLERNTRLASGPPRGGPRPARTGRADPADRGASGGPMSGR